MAPTGTVTSVQIVASSAETVGTVVSRALAAERILR